MKKQTKFYFWLKIPIEHAMQVLSQHLTKHMRDHIWNTEVWGLVYRGYNIGGEYPTKGYQAHQSKTVHKIRRSPQNT